VRANKHEPSEILRKEGESEMEAMQANDRNATLAIGAVRTQDQAERLIEILKRTGFSDQDLSVILPTTN
jgi:hypothetical protein